MAAPPRGRVYRPAAGRFGEDIEVEKLLAWISIGCVLLVIWLAIALLFAWPFMLAWNYAVVAAINVARPIDYWTAVVLMWFMGAFVVSARSHTK